MASFMAAHLPAGLCQRSKVILPGIFYLFSSLNSNPLIHNLLYLKASVQDIALCSIFIGGEGVHQYAGPNASRARDRRHKIAIEIVPRRPGHRPDGDGDQKSRPSFCENRHPNPAKLFVRFYGFQIGAGLS
jgi:hypothetical protein